MILSKSINKVVTEKEYDDIEQNKVVKVDIINDVRIFGWKIFSNRYTEDLVSVEGGEYKSKEKKIGF